MRGKSHLCLGKYLAHKYMNNIPKPYVRAFLIGCLEPDRNPATYLKGSIRYQWLRGHNFHNARRYMRKISHRLECKEHWNLLDYYTLGKLIHYTTDAFTFAHNDTFPANLSAHREYETALQRYFLAYLQEDPQIDPHTAHSIMDAIYSYHFRYEDQQADIHCDTTFALNACCCVLAILLTNRMI